MIMTVIQKRKLSNCSERRAPRPACVLGMQALHVQQLRWSGYAGQAFPGSCDIASGHVTLLLTAPRHLLDGCQ